MSASRVTADTYMMKHSNRIGIVIHFNLSINPGLPNKQTRHIINCFPVDQRLNDVSARAQKTNKYDDNKPFSVGTYYII